MNVNQTNTQTSSLAENYGKKELLTREDSLEGGYEEMLVGLSLYKHLSTMFEVPKITARVARLTASRNAKSTGNVFERLSLQTAVVEGCEPKQLGSTDHGIQRKQFPIKYPMLFRY